MKQRTGMGSTTYSSTSGLTEITVASCGDVVGVSELAPLPKLNKIVFQHCATQERWEDLPRVAEGFVMAVSPFPSVEFLEERRAAGWIVPQPWEGEPVDALTVDESADGEGWGVYMSDFDDLAGAVELLDGSVPGGLHGELLILGVVAELKGQGALLEPEPDSESSFTAVYFPDQHQAEKAYSRAKEVLASDAEAQLAYLRSAGY